MKNKTIAFAAIAFVFSLSRVQANELFYMVQFDVSDSECRFPAIWKTTNPEPDTEYFWDIASDSNEILEALDKAWRISDHRDWTQAGLRSARNAFWRDRDLASAAEAASLVPFKGTRRESDLEWNCRCEAAMCRSHDMTTRMLETARRDSDSPIFDWNLFWEHCRVSDWGGARNCAQAVENHFDAFPPYGICLYFWYVLNCGDTKEQERIGCLIRNEPDRWKQQLFELSENEAVVLSLILNKLETTFKDKSDETNPDVLALLHLRGLLETKEAVSEECLSRVTSPNGIEVPFGRDNHDVDVSDRFVAGWIGDMRIEVPLDTFPSGLEPQRGEDMFPFNCEPVVAAYVENFSTNANLSAETKLILGMCLMTEMRYEEASRLLESLFRDDPNNCRVLRALIMSLAALHDSGEKALGYGLEATRRFNDAASASIALWEALSLNDLKAARELIEIGLFQSPYDEIYLRSMFEGVLLYCIKEPDESESRKVFQRLLDRFYRGNADSALQSCFQRPVGALALKRFFPELLPSGMSAVLGDSLPEVKIVFVPWKNKLQ